MTLQDNDFPNPGNPTAHGGGRRGRLPPPSGRNSMSLGFILLVLFALLLLGALPAWPHSRGWGYYPSSGFGLVLIIIVLLLVTHRI